MRYPEDELIDILKKGGVDFICSLPCEKFKNLLELIYRNFPHAPLTREEEGVGICAGAALSGKRPAIFVQSSGIGNMINALLSLTGFYRLPLAIFVSHRGIYKEKIPAQTPMGRSLPKILKGAGVGYTNVSRKGDLRLIEKKLKAVYQKEKIHAFLLSPAVWEKSEFKMQDARCRIQDAKTGIHHGSYIMNRVSSSEPMHYTAPPRFTRYDILDIIAPYINSKVVICNLGFPAKELFYIKHQPSNFYMLGSMGMALPIGLGVALTSKKDVVVIDGDGSLLMNPGSLATTAYFSPKNLTIFAIDNGSYGSTGDQPTLTGSCVDLELVAKGFGIKNTFKVATEKELINVMKKAGKGLRFIHSLAIPGNKDLPNILLNNLENKKQVQEFLSKK